MQNRFTRVVAGGALALLCHTATANDTKGTLTLALENDLLGKGSDSHYTHGTELTYVSETNPWATRLAHILPWHSDDDESRLQVSLAQQIYTPDDLTREALIEDDRPYAGWLGASFGLLNTKTSGPSRHVDRLALVIGLVGPDSGAENIQREVHEIADSVIPRGWDNQLDDEWTVDVQYQRQWVTPLLGETVDLVPQVIASLGTSQRYLGAGATLRFGSGLQADYGPPLIRPTASGSHFFQPDQAFYWYLFVGAHGRYVGYNIFLDGNTDGDSHSVEAREWVGDIQGGLVVGWDSWRLAVTNIIRSREFDQQEQPDEFGAVTVSYRF